MTEGASTRLFGFSLEELSKIIGGGIVAIYLLGYVVLSFYFSNYGFSQTNPLRPRVLEAGVCCLVFTSLPLVLGLVIEFIPSRNLSSTQLIALKLGILPILCDYLVSLPGFTAGMDYSNPMQMFLTTVTRVRVSVLVSITIVSLLLFAFFVLWLWRCYHRHTIAVIIILWSLSFLLLRMHWQTRHLPSSHLFFWFCGAALMAPLGSFFVKLVETRDLVSSKGAVEHLDSHTSLSHLKTSRKFYRPISTVTSLTLFVFIFVTWVYGFIPFRLGGGHPIGVTVALKRSGDSLRIIHGALLDESDRGYYLLLPVAEHAVFLSRDDVKFVYYSDTDTTNISGLE